MGKFNSRLCFVFEKNMINICQKCEKNVFDQTNISKPFKFSLQSGKQPLIYLHKLFRLFTVFMIIRKNL